METFSWADRFKFNRGEEEHCTLYLFVYLPMRQTPTRIYIRHGWPSSSSSSINTVDCEINSQLIFSLHVLSCCVFGRREICTIKIMLFPFERPPPSTHASSAIHCLLASLAGWLWIRILLSLPPITSIHPCSMSGRMGARTYISGWQIIL